ncbi:MAG TPA: hypothetical protein VGD42_05405 [Lysobacter sp.]
MLGLALAAAAAGAAWWWSHESPGSAPPAHARAATPAALVMETPHFRIVSTATPEQTREVALAVERLHAALAAFLPDAPSARADGQRMQLVLYRDQAEFKANNRSTPWAEAYYRPPACHAYYAQGERNPVHWMLHEVTHQFAREVAAFPRARWSDEGLASYFGASRIVDGTLVPGRVDPDTYPIWWLPRLALSGDLDEDIAKGRLIPLRALIEGDGPPIGEHVNTYYIQFWSLTHFLLQHDGGRHAPAYRRLLARGGSLGEFEAAFGPVERVQAQWYAHLQAQVAALGAAPE